MNYIIAMYASAIQQWKQISFTGGNLSFHLATIPMVAVFTWIAMQRGDPEVISYLLVGLPMMTVWSGVAFRIGYTLTIELSNQVLQFVYISQTPVIVVSLGKALAQVIWGLPTGLISFFVVYFMTGTSLQIANPGFFIFSLVLVVIGIAVASLFFSPMMVLVGGRAGFFNTIIPFGLVLTGFVFPVDRLPPVLEVMARCMPTSWAMEAVRLSISGDVPATWFGMVTAWGISILASIGLAGVTYLMFRAVEQRIRITGTRDFY